MFIIFWFLKIYIVVMWYIINFAALQGWLLVCTIFYYLFSPGLDNDDKMSTLHSSCLEYSVIIWPSLNQLRFAIICQVLQFGMQEHIYKWHYWCCIILPFLPNVCSNFQVKLCPHITHPFSKSHSFNQKGNHFKYNVDENCTETNH